MSQIRILCIGDVVGYAGRSVFQRHAARLKAEHKVDVLIVNGENSADDGRGITPHDVATLRNAGADVITSGNHIWAKRDIYPYLEQHTDLIRPCNFPTDVPGSGIFLGTSSLGYSFAVINVQGRVFMRELLACPFRALDSLITYAKTKASVIIVDMHAEATSEKLALANYIDGRVSAVVGTHTHIQTADYRILPNGTAYITDLGMVGSLESMIGMKKEPVIRQFLTQMPVRFITETEPPYVMSGILCTVDIDSGKASDIKPIRIIDPQPI